MFRRGHSTVPATEAKVEAISQEAVIAHFRGVRQYESISGLGCDSAGRNRRRNRLSLMAFGHIFLPAARSGTIPVHESGRLSGPRDRNGRGAVARDRGTAAFAWLRRGRIGLGGQARENDRQTCRV